MAERQTTQTTLELRTVRFLDFFTFSDDTLTERLMNPECSHCVAYSYLWPVVMNVSWSSLHSTLYTVWVQVVFRGRVNCWAHRIAPPPRLLRSQPPVRGRSRRGASIAWCFHPASNRQKGDEMTSQKRPETERDASGCPAYVLAAVDELVYGHHTVFVLIHLLSGD